MSFPNYSPRRGTAPTGGTVPTIGGRPRGDSAVSSLLGQAGQALGAVGSPSRAPGPPGRADWAARQGSLSGLSGSQHQHQHQHQSQSQSQDSPTLPALPPSSSMASFGHPHQRQHQPHHRSHYHQSPISPPATSSTTTNTDTSLRQPPVSTTGTGSGTGLGIASHHFHRRSDASAASSSSSRAAFSSAAPWGQSRYQTQTQPNPAGLSTSSSSSSSYPSHTHHTHAHPHPHPHPHPHAAPSPNYRAASYAEPGQLSPKRTSQPPDHRAVAPSNVLDPGLRPTAGSRTGTGSDPGPAATLFTPPMFDLPSIPTSNDDFASIPYLNSTATPTSASAAAPTPKDAMSQQPQQPHYSASQRRTTGYGDDQQQQQQQQQPHMQSSSQYQQHGQMSPRDYSTPSTGPHIKLEQAPSNPSSYQGSPAVPSVLQPGGTLARPPPVGANSASSLSTMQGSIPQQQDYQTPAKPALSLSHSYSRSSPAAAYDGTNPGFSPYTPTTPGAPGPSSAQFMSPSDRSYNAPGSQRNISHTPLGLADIRPRADSSLSDGMPSGLDFAMQNTPPGTSNYMAPWATYAFDWCKWAPQGNGAGKVAIGSYLEDGHNFIQILDTQINPTPPDVYNNHGGSKWTMDFTKIAEATHSYPVTRLLWEPPSSTKQSTDLLATSGDHLRLWSLPSETPSTPGNSITGRNREAATTKLTPLALLSNSKTPDHTAPLTSLDWNTVSPSLIITSSIDTTCTIWDIPSLTAKTQLIAHDKEVYDVRFCANSVDVFVSCGQDGSVRMFDLRSLEHSTIIYEPTGKEDRVDPNGGKMSPTLAQQTMSNPPPLLRLATSPHDTQLLATFAQDSNVIRILDTRQPGQALLELRGHGGALNCVEWSPTRRGQLASGGDDCQVLIWDLMNQPQSNGTPQSDNIRSPVASWQCDYEVSNLGWVPRLPNDEAAEWLGVSGGRGLWGVRM